MQWYFTEIYRNYGWQLGGVETVIILAVTTTINTLSLSEIVNADEYLLTEDMISYCEDIMHFALVFFFGLPDNPPVLEAFIADVILAEVLTAEVMLIELMTTESM